MLFVEFNMDDARRVWTEEGKTESKIEGKIEGKIETAMNLLREGMKIDLILKVTGLSEIDIKKLQENLKKEDIKS